MIDHLALFFFCLDFDMMRMHLDVCVCLYMIAVPSGYGTQKLEDAIKHVTKIKFGRGVNTAKCVKTDAATLNATTYLDLNIKPLSLKSTTHLIDLVVDYEGDIDLNECESLMSQNTYNSLPDPIKPKAPVDQPYYMQLNIRTKENNKHDIIKWYTFQEKVSFLRDSATVHSQ